MSFGFIVAAFLATANAGRVAAAREQAGPGARSVAVALLAGAALIVAGVLFADDLLEALSIEPESFRIAAGIVLGVMGARTLAWPAPAAGAPFAAVLITPELACAALSFGADEPVGRALGAAAVALLVAAAAATARLPVSAARTAQFLAALQIVIGVALVISGMRDV